MKKFGIGLVFFLAAALAAGEGVVTADVLNARQRPSVKAPVMFRLKKGDAVRVISVEENNWMAISLPENAPVYVSEAYVVGGKALRNVKMYSGKGRNFPVWGELAKGEAVKLVDDRGYGWVRIVPPESLKAYVCTLYVKVENKPEAKQVEAKPEDKAEGKKAEAAKPEDKSEEKKEEAAKPEDKSAVKPAAKADAKKTEAAKPKQAEKAAAPAKPFKPDEVLLSLGITEKSKGKEVKLKGVLLSVAKSGSRATDFALSGDKVNLGFIYAPGRAAELKKLVDKEVEVVGTSFNIKDWHSPVVLVQSVKLVR